MSLEKQKVKDTLLGKFQFQEVVGTRHDAVAFFHNGKKIATTRFSRGVGKDLDDDLLQLIAREILVSSLGFFKGMITCTQSRQDYIKRLNDNGYI